VICRDNAASGGIKKGDIVKEINDTAIQFWDEVRSNTMKGEVNRLLVSRDGKDVNLTIDLAGQDTFGIYSFGVETLEKAISTETYGIGESITGGISMGLNNLRDYGNQF